MAQPLKKAPARRIVGARSKSSVQNGDSKSSAQNDSKSSTQNGKAKSSSQNGSKAEPKNDALLATPSSLAAENREAWLGRGIELLRPAFIDAGMPLPETVRASIGWTRARKALAECWHSSVSNDGATEIFVIPSNDFEDTMRIFGILCHELCHAALPRGTSHKKPFVELATSMLLEGPARTMEAGDAFRARWKDSVAALGPFPAKSMQCPETLSGSGRPKSPKKRKLKMTCPECHMTFRLASKWLTEKPLQCPDRDCVGYLGHE